MPTYTPLQSIQLATDATSFTFSNIPQTYQDLVLVCNYLKSNNAALRLSFNGDTATNYSSTTLYGNGTSALSGRETSVSYFYAMDYITSTSTVPNQTIININNYSNTTTYKTILDRSGGTSDGLVASVGLWRKSTEAINNINISRSSGIFYAGATFDLYGISPVAAQTAQAFGGTEIYYDSTYVYHVFKGSGTFTPYRSLSADILVVAGGGGAGVGGGGAGGLLGYASQSLTANTSYAVTVGAGGPAGVSTTTASMNGSNSQFGSLTASAGGGGGGLTSGSSSTYNGANGGSGGGGGFSSGSPYTQGTAGSASPSGQGYAGGIGITSGSVTCGGGGGGAGAVGSNGVTAGYGVAGGAGSSSYSTWGLATSTGQLVSSTYYYAGGGGSQGDYGGGSGGNGGGGAGVGGTNKGNSGITNTGGGGGGGYTTGGNGGSGIVIVRYAR